MDYDFRKIEKEWQQKWKDDHAYRVNNPSPGSGFVAKPKYYVLDMFPYPSGAGLHVGHPLGYIASDIYARFKRLKGYNVLHPMGYDAFGLPAEQYAIEQGVHPAVSTEQNINNFRKQLDNIGFCFDWHREVRTSDPKYYKWTQWIFLQLFKSWYNHSTKRAESISELETIFEKNGSSTVNRQLSTVNNFTAEQWKNFTEPEKQNILMDYRLAYCGYGEVNWCEALGTVLANDEVVNGVSERGGYPVVKKKLRQWYLRITDYADRLLEGLDHVEFSEAMKEMQTNWIGKSYGAEIDFRLKTEKSIVENLRVYTTRPDTIFGVDFMVVAPELEWIPDITGVEQQVAVEEYIGYVKSRSERERQAEKKITGCFTGAYAVNPFNGREIPVWISEYVLAGYGTGAIMAVPCGDERDFKFATHFGIPITNIIGDFYNGEEANPTKDAKLVNSDFLDGSVMRDAIAIVNKKLEELGIGTPRVNYRMRDAAFSRQRYWGEPFPIIWENGVAYPLDESELPLELPHVDSYKPGPDGEGPLANIPEWYLIPGPSPQVEKGAHVRQGLQVGTGQARGAALVPRYAVSTPKQFELAKEMRKGHTEAENILWEELRGDKLGEKFRRQHLIDAYIVDFICLQKKLIVEVDGEYHSNEEQREYDKNRTTILNDIGFTVIRFTNEEVITQINTVIQKIKSALNKQNNKGASLDSNSKQSRTEAPLSTRGEGPGVRETNTMPGYAGSSWYFLRYMDPHNDNTFCDRKVSDYWGQVDLYVGGTEHAVGHLLYSRMWTKCLYDLGYIGFDEPFKRLMNQGMITGVSQMICRFDGKIFKEGLQFPGESFPFSMTMAYGRKKTEEDGMTPMKRFIVTFDKAYIQYFSSDFDILDLEDMTQIHVPIELVDSNKLDVAALTNSSYWNKERDGVFICNDGYFLDGQWYDFSHQPIKPLTFKTISVVEKMSKSKFNTINPNDLVQKYGADTFRMYEMFLGPVDQSKPWDTKGIEGVHRFLRKLWRLFYDEMKGKVWTTEKATDAELKVLHRAIKKIEEDTERFSFNTAVSALMIAVNELGDLKCHKKEILEKLLIILTPYAPHIAEELWRLIGNNESILDAAYPQADEKYLIESTKNYPIAINGKTRTELNIALDTTQEQVEEIILADEVVKKWLDGKPPKKIIYVKNKMINVVV